MFWIRQWTETRTNLKMFAAVAFSAMTLGLLVGSVPLGLGAAGSESWLIVGKVVPLLTISGSRAWSTWECAALLNVRTLHYLGAPLLMLHVFGWAMWFSLYVERYETFCLVRVLANRKQSQG
jgi:hypothetical protein